MGEAGKEGKFRLDAAQVAEHAIAVTAGDQRDELGQALPLRQEVLRALSFVTHGGDFAVRREAGL